MMPRWSPHRGARVRRTSLRFFGGFSIWLDPDNDPDCQRCVRILLLLMHPLNRFGSISTIRPQAGRFDGPSPAARTVSYRYRPGRRPRHYEFGRSPRRPCPSHGAPENVQVDGGCQERCHNSGRGRCQSKAISDGDPRRSPPARSVAVHQRFMARSPASRISDCP